MSNMGERQKPVTIEPFLEVYYCSFRAEFLLFDQSLNDAQISPLRLTIPEKRVAKRAKPVVVEQEKPAPPQKFRLIPKSQLINPRKAKIRTGNAPKVNKRVGENELSADEGLNEESEIAQLVKSRQNESEVRRLRPIETTETIVNLNEYNMNLIMEREHVGIFYLKFQQGNVNSNHMYIVDAETNQILMKISKKGKLKTHHIVVTNPQSDEMIFQVIPLERNIFASEIVQNDKHIPLSVFHELESKSKFKQFEAFLPKDLDNPTYDPMKLINNSNLSIKFQTKPPKMKGNIPVLYFGGRVKMESTKNCVLTPDFDHDTRTLVFGKISESIYVGEVYYPLTPIQAISLCLPHFF